MPESPERTALYRLYDADNRLLHVGISNDPDFRWKAHLYAMTHFRPSSSAALCTPKGSYVLPGICHRRSAQSRDLRRRENLKREYL